MIWSWCLSSVSLFLTVCLWEHFLAQHFLPVVWMCGNSTVWLKVKCVCRLNSACVFLYLCVCDREMEWDACLPGCRAGLVAACRDDGIGKQSLSLHPTAKPAGRATAISSPCLLLSPSSSLTYWLYFSHLSLQAFFLIFFLRPLPASCPLSRHFRATFHVHLVCFWINFAPVAFCFLPICWFHHSTEPTPLPLLCQKLCKDWILEWKSQDRKRQKNYICVWNTLRKTKKEK